MNMSFSNNLSHDEEMNEEKSSTEKVDYELDAEDSFLNYSNSDSGITKLIHAVNILLTN